ncbi:hypothetical protein CDAR_478551 [Caerostris darwini]|uniref:Uncharacterized protein n=1 Tax=Caerostris darwini TaxID=1538125 RepID=A0AAV4QQS4_9ARAC|nr:hypothetical protein CDAR_478551 [Caerostris darwini]
METLETIITINYFDDNYVKKENIVWDTIYYDGFFCAATFIRLRSSSLMIPYTMGYTPIARTLLSPFWSRFTSPNEMKFSPHLAYRLECKDSQSVVEFSQTLKQLTGTATSKL